MGKQANIAIYSVGVFGHDKTLARAEYVSSQKVDELLGIGAVGDMFSRVINIDGQICDKELDERTIGIELKDLKKKKYSIAVAGGISKTECIYAALAGGYANVLITDEDAAREIIKSHDRRVSR
jgi:deoxyribonucleoside regulator